jgi:hypothetical protein
LGGQKKRVISIVEDQVVSPFPDAPCNGHSDCSFLLIAAPDEEKIREAGRVVIQLKVMKEAPSFMRTEVVEEKVVHIFVMGAGGASHRVRKD